jgi:hypothetical protein
LGRCIATDFQCVDIADDDLAAQLNDAEAQRYLAVERRGSPHHAIDADHRGFDDFSGRKRDDERYDCAGREVDAIDLFFRLEQHMLLFEMRRPQMGCEKSQVGRRKQLEQKVLHQTRS